MGFKENFQQQYAKAYFEKYGDRLTQIQGNVISVKFNEKSILGIFNKLKVTMVIKPDRSKTIIKCFYKKNKWFKKPEFIAISQGNLVIIQGLKGKKTKKKKKKNADAIQIINVCNLTTKKDLIPIEGKAAQVQKIQRKYK